MTDICKSSNDPQPNCVNQPLPPQQCTQSYIQDCSSPGKVCGRTPITPGPNPACRGTGGQGSGRPCCNSQSGAPWVINDQFNTSGVASCKPFPTTVCPAMTGTPPIVNPSGTCFSLIDTTNFTSLSNFQSSFLPAAEYCQWDLNIFTDEKNVQKYFDTFFKGDPDNLGAKDFKFNSDQYGNKIMPFFCQQESKTGCGSTGYTKCSNFISSTLCKEWAGKAFSRDPTGNTSGGLYTQQVSDTMSAYCTNSSTNPPPCTSGSSITCPGRDGDWVDECQCINSDKDPVFQALNTGDPFPPSCWYRPCEPLNGVGLEGNQNNLQPPITFTGVTSTGICPNNVCEAITLNFDKSNLNEKDVNQDVTCQQTRNAASKTNNSITSVFSKNKGWIIGLTVGAVVLLILIIAIVILTRSHHTKKKPTLQQQLAEFEP